MSIDGKLLVQAKKRLDDRRSMNAAEASRRRERLFEANPKLKELDTLIKSTMMEAIGAALAKGGDPERAVAEIGERNMLLQMDMGRELRQMGYPEDYLDDIYTCRKCMDTGYTGGRMCSCLSELYKDEQRKELSGLLKLGSETFDSFDLDWYDDIEGGRELMETVYENCVQYARKFSARSGNLLLRGSTGLGKTFLSTCIAKVVSERGFTVVYDTAASIFARFEEEKFSRGEAPEEVYSEIHRYMSCDLLIVDDLGTEMTTSFVTSALYNLINTRLMTNKKTIVNTNLTTDEIKQRYSPQIYSRLMGEYQLINFYGNDIRLKKNEL